jgi:hypothetical protein
MAQSGLSRERIWSETGWFTGEDGLWRYEVSDYGATLNPAYAEQSLYLPDGGPVGNVLQHPALDAAGGYGSKGLLDWKLKPERRPGFYGRAELGKETITTAKNPYDIFRSTILHELQHAAQYLEGFVNGGNSKQFLPADFDVQRSVVNVEFARRLKAVQDIYKKNGNTVGPAYKTAYDSYQTALQDLNRINEMKNKAIAEYHNIGGEREARNVEKRSTMTPEQLKQNPPWSTIGPYEKVN